MQSEIKCSYCEQKADKKCKECETPYCSRICQRKDWDNRGHKYKCTNFRKYENYVKRKKENDDNDDNDNDEKDPDDNDKTQSEQIQKKTRLEEKNILKTRIEALQNGIAKLKRELSHAESELSELLRKQRLNFDAGVSPNEIDKVRAYLQSLYFTYLGIDNKFGPDEKRWDTNKAEQIVNSYVTLTISGPGIDKFNIRFNNNKTEFDSKKLIGSDEYYEHDWDATTEFTHKRDRLDLDQLREEFLNDRKFTPFPPPSDIIQLMKKMKITLKSQGIRKTIFKHNPLEVGETITDVEEEGEEHKWGF